MTLRAPITITNQKQMHSNNKPISSYKIFTLFILLVGIFQTLTGYEKPHTTTKMRNETRYVIESLERIHYLNEPISQINNKEFLENYIHALDANRIYFFQSDIDSYLDRFSQSIDIYLRQGNLFPAFEVYATFYARIENRLAWVFEKLDGGFNFNKIESFKPDRKEEQWPENRQISDDLWRRRLEYEILNEILTSSVNQELIQIVRPPYSQLIYTNRKLDKFQYFKPLIELNNKLPPILLEDLAPFKVFPKANVRKFITDATAPYIPLTELAEARKSIKKRYERIKKTLLNLEPFEVQEIFLTTLTHMYDPHSTFFSADSLEEFSISISNSLVGIGAVLADENDVCTIKRLLPGGPAEKSNVIQPEDKIVAVGQGEKGAFVDIIGMRLRKVVKQIRGEKGSKVRLLIEPADGGPANRKEVIITRDEIQLTSNLAKANLYEFPLNGKTRLIGVINLPAFYGSGDDDPDEPNTTGDVEELIIKLKNSGIEGLVLDLRRNGGGLLSEAISLTGLFIPQGPVVQVKDTIGQIRFYNDENPSVAWDGPLMVLTTLYSASASEIFTGALLNYNRALVVGDKSTHGKGTVQAVFEMDRSFFPRSDKPQMGAAKVTVQKWYLPDGTSTQLKGVESHITIPSINEFLPIAESDYPNPLKWDSIKSLTYNEYSPFTMNTEILRQKSIQRQASLEEFHYLRKNINWFKSKQVEKEYSLHFTNRFYDLYSDNQFRQDLNDQLDDLIKHNFQSSEVLLDAAEKNKDSSFNPKNQPSFDIHLRESLRIMNDWLDSSSSKKPSIAVSEPAI